MANGGTLRVALRRTRAAARALRPSQIDGQLHPRRWRSRCATRDPKIADDPGHQGRQPAHPRRRARPRRRGLRRRADRRSRSSTPGNGELEVAARARSTSSTREGSLSIVDRDERLLRQPVPAPARPREPVAHRARPLRRDQQARSRRSRSCARACGASARATRSSTTRSTCCSTTTSSWSRSSARPAPARRCSRSPRACRRCVEERRLPEAARLAPDLPARPRHRLSARRHRGEAQPVDAADLRQRRAAPRLLEGRQEGGPHATTS